MDLAHVSLKASLPRRSISGERALFLLAILDMRHAGSLDDQMSLVGVRRGKAAFFSGCKSHPAIAPAGSNRSSHGDGEMAETFGIACHELVTARVCRPQRE